MFLVYKKQQKWEGSALHTVEIGVGTLPQSFWAGVWGGLLILYFMTYNNNLMLMNRYIYHFIVRGNQHKGEGITAIVFSVWYDLYLFLNPTLLGLQNVRVVFLFVKGVQQINKFKTNSKCHV